MKRKSIKLEGEKLELLRKSSDRAIEALYSNLYSLDELSITELKNVSTILKTLTAVQRDLNNLPTFKEENTLKMSEERLKIVREKMTTVGDAENESGIVFMPLAEDEEGEGLSEEEDYDA
jgi:hypothetical protein